MHAQDALEAESRRLSAAFTTREARARFRVEPNPLGRSFRAWCRASFNAFACAGKLAQVVTRKDDAR